MTIAIPDATETKILEKSDTKRAVWFQNFDTAEGIYIYPKQNADVASPADEDEEFYLAPAASATSPSSLIVQVNSRDETIVNSAWYAYQASGGSVNINCGKW